MKNLILAAFAALSLSAVAVDAANAAPAASVQRQGSYDNTGHGPQQTGLEGGGG